MKILKVDRKNNCFEAIPDSFDDLWHIEKLVEKGDLVSGESERKIKPKTEGEKAFRQKIFVEIEAEKTDYQEATNQLRILGIVTSAKPEELVALKAHHAIEVEPGTKITVKKKELKNYHVERLERAKNASGREKLLLVVMDDEEAELAFLKDNGLETKTRILAGKSGKRYENKEKGNKYFDEITSAIENTGAEKIVIAGPGFEKDKFRKFLDEKKPGKKISYETTNSVGITGLNELVKTGKIDKLIENYHSAEEAKAVEKILQGLGLGEASVGFEETKKAVDANAVETLTISEKTIAEQRQKTEEIIDKADRLGAKIIFVNPKSEAGKQLEGLGGIAASLRYKMR